MQWLRTHGTNCIALRNIGEYCYVQQRLNMSQRGEIPLMKINKNRRRDNEVEKHVSGIRFHNIIINRGGISKTIFE